MPVSGICRLAIQVGSKHFEIKSCRKKRQHKSVEQSVHFACDGQFYFSTIQMYNSQEEEKTKEKRKRERFLSGVTIFDENIFLL